MRNSQGLSIRRVLGAQLDDCRFALAGGPGLFHGIVFPVRGVVGQNVKASQRLDLPAHARPGTGMPRSTIFLRRVLRLIPNSAAARIWLPSVWANTASSSGRSAPSRMRR